VETDGAARALTQSDRAGLDAGSFVAPELIHFPSFDGLSIPAFYYLPQTPQPAGGYPCILYVHGGPTSQLRPDFDVRFQYFLSRGYAILGTNVRGSTGYGRAYAALDEIEKRPDSVADLKHAVLWLHERAEIDGSRVAVYGRSYGGFMVLAALTTYPELFAAGIDVVGSPIGSAFWSAPAPGGGRTGKGSTAAWPSIGRCWKPFRPSTGPTVSQCPCWSSPGTTTLACHFSSRN